MSAVEEVLEGLIVVFCASGLVMSTICAAWLAVDAVASLIRRIIGKGK